jgi:hypothetical protein
MARARVHELEAICSNRLNSSYLADLASCYFTLGDSAKALPLAHQTWLWDRKEPGLGTNLGMIYKDLGMHPESAHAVETAYWTNPDDFYVRLAYAEALLKAGFWKQAWVLYDNCRPTQAGAAMDVAIPSRTPEWDGSPLPEGHKLIVINEGGTGDRVSYARWLPKLTEMGIDWIFYSYTPLFSIFERVFPRDRLIADGQEIDGFTHWVTPFSLPAKLNVSPRDIPPPLQFTALPDRIEKFKITRANDKPVVGICYKAAELFQGGRSVRSLTEAEAMRIICMTGDKVNWVNLQYGERPLPFPVVNTNILDWEDTLGLIHNLDAVVSVDTSVLHLAGTLNKPMAVPLSSNSCWKWLKINKLTPWYPTAKLYRNDGHGQGFAFAIEQLIQAIRDGSAFK